ncbi:hypothetical protein BpHYR1_054639 [Brachionus plicatilis]|uniref:Uncharacterized protein n=1 Tax=Brachionus plicatilis TaxID=10195 RepID=A0A3M7R1S4_BRAPC|nr:hypothetical protein BpHYR1_054639 [Brachionus plicatilis]
MTSKLAPLTAACNGVQPSLSWAFMSALFSTKNLTISKLASMHAWCNAVKPSTLVVFIFTPIFKCCFTSSVSPLVHAAKKTVWPQSILSESFISFSFHRLICSSRFFCFCILASSKNSNHNRKNQIHIKNNLKIKKKRKLQKENFLLMFLVSYSNVNK